MAGIDDLSCGGTVAAESVNGGGIGMHHGTASEVLVSRDSGLTWSTALLNSPMSPFTGSDARLVALSAGTDYVTPVEVSSDGTIRFLITPETHDDPILLTEDGVHERTTALPHSATRDESATARMDNETVHDLIVVDGHIVIATDEAVLGNQYDDVLLAGDRNGLSVRFVGSPMPDPA